MIARIIEWSIRRRGLVAAFALALLVAGGLYVRTMPVDAIPDLSDVQVIVYTDYPGPGAAGGRGPGHLSAGDRHARRAKDARWCGDSPCSAPRLST